MWFYTVSEKAFGRIRKDIALWFIHIYIHIIYIYTDTYICRQHDRYRVSRFRV